VGTWNIIHTLRAGARVKVEVTPNIRVYPPQPPTNENDYITIKAINFGTGPTTITHCAGYYTKSIWGLVKKSERQQFIINITPQTGKDIPFILEPGTEWSNLAAQSDLFEKAGDGYLYLGIIHNQRSKPIYKRVKKSKLTEA
jgi:hypothetical protein